MSTYQSFIDKPPIVFISYSWSSDEYKNKVIELAKRLLSDGVEVRIDVWDLKEGQDKYEFMEQMVRDESISKVLIICNKRYAEKANAREGGVGEETQIITPEIYNKNDQTRFIPIVFERDEDGTEYLPIYLRTRIYLDLSNPDKFEDEYQRLLRVIFQRPENEKPPIGTPPTFIFDEKATSITKTISIVNRFKNQILEGNTNAIGVYEHYIETLFNILTTDFKIDEISSDVPIDDLIIENINAFLPYRDEFIDMLRLILSYKLDISYFQVLFRFFTNLLNLFFGPITDQKSLLLDNYRFIVWELFLYLTSLLVFERRLAEFRLFTNSMYYIESPYSTGLEPYVEFRQFINTLDEIRKKRTQSRLISLAVTELKQRCHKDISFELLMQCDLILFLKSKKIQEKRNDWFPSTLIYAHGRKFEFFIRAFEVKVFSQLLQFIQYDNKAELVSILRDDRVLKSEYFFWSHINSDYLINFEKIGTINTE